MTDAAEPQAETVADSEPLALDSRHDDDHGETGTDAVSETIEIVKTVVYALLIALVLRIFLFQPFTIPSASMEPNLLKGDYIIVSKYSYGYSKHSIPLSPPLFKGRIFARQPTRGDIIVFKLPSDGHIDYIKRLIGLPGDRIQVKGGVVSVNGQVLTRVYDGPGDPGSCWNGSTVQRFRETNTVGRTYTTYDCGPRGDVDDTGLYVVPEGHYFFMGDNRDNSLDSRVAPEASGVGFVPAENLVGHARIILLSWNGEASLFKPWTWFLDARPSRFFHVLK
ncbi:MAG: signal peptidase I [Caulobacter sp.]|nr:signal peptidase I [Caulobacter sp.]